MKRDEQTSIVDKFVLRNPNKSLSIELLKASNFRVKSSRYPKLLGFEMFLW